MPSFSILILSLPSIFHDATLLSQHFAKMFFHSLADKGGAPVHEILQARTLVWVAVSSSGGTTNQTCVSCVSCIGKWFLYY